MFSFGLGLPFLLLGTFSNLIAARPKPGAWMEGVKSVLGIFMFVIALYVLRGIFTQIDSVFYSTPLYFAAMIILIILGLFSGAIHLSYHHSSWLKRARKTIGIIFVIVGVFGVIGAMAWSDGTKYGKNIRSENREIIEWTHDLDQGLLLAKKIKKPVLVDFSAEWCIACKELDKLTFTDSLVAKELNRFVCIKVDLSRSTPETRKITNRYGIKGIPVLEFYSSGGLRLIEKRVTGFVEADDFLRIIKEIE
jgi:thiol:disulfide interchange protein DsbD